MALKASQTQDKCGDLIRGDILSQLSRLHSAACVCLSPDCPGIQHPGRAVPRAGHIRRGDLGRLSVPAGSDAPHALQRMLHGPGRSPGPRRHLSVRVESGLFPLTHTARLLLFFPDERPLTLSVAVRCDVTLCEMSRSIKTTQRDCKRTILIMSVRHADEKPRIVTFMRVFNGSHLKTGPGSGLQVRIFL